MKNKKYLLLAALILIAIIILLLVRCQQEESPIISQTHTNAVEPAKAAETSTSEYQGKQKKEITGTGISVKSRRKVGGPVIEEGLYYTLVNANGEKVDFNNQSQPTLYAPPGKYLLFIKAGDVIHNRPVEVDKDVVKDYDFVLSTGRISLKSSLTEGGEVITSSPAINYYIDVPGIEKEWENLGFNNNTQTSFEVPAGKVRVRVRMHDYFRNFIFEVAAGEQLEKLLVLDMGQLYIKPMLSDNVPADEELFCYSVNNTAQGELAGNCAREGRYWLPAGEVSYRTYMSYHPVEGAGKINIEAGEMLTELVNVDAGILEVASELPSAWHYIFPVGSDQRLTHGGNNTTRVFYLPAGEYRVNTSYQNPEDKSISSVATVKAGKTSRIVVEEK